MAFATSINLGYLYSSSTARLEGRWSKKNDLEYFDSTGTNGRGCCVKSKKSSTKLGAFSSVDELDAIPGIGPARLDQLRGLVAP